MSGISQVDGDCDTPGNLLKVWGFVYDGDGVKVKQVYTEGTTTLTTYYYAGGSYEVQTDGVTQTVRQYYSIAGMTVAMRSGEDWSFFLTDHLGSVVGVVDDEGALTAETRYMPHGEVRINVGTISSTDYGYTFQRNLPDTGLVDYKARAYDPYLARFVQPDTIVPGAGNPQAWNRYGYVNNNPIKYIDPSGHRLGTNYSDMTEKEIRKLIKYGPPKIILPSDIVCGYFEENPSLINYYEESADDSGNEELNRAVGIQSPLPSSVPFINAIGLGITGLTIANNIYNFRPIIQEKILNNPPEVCTALYYNTKVTGIMWYDEKFINLTNIQLVNVSGWDIDNSDVVLSLCKIRVKSHSNSGANRTVIPG